MKGSVVANSPLLYVLIAIGLIGVVIFALVCAKKTAARCFSCPKILHRNHERKERFIKLPYFCNR